MLSTCGDYVEDMLSFAQCSINILSNHKKGTSTALWRLLFINEVDTDVHAFVSCDSLGYT